MYRIHAHADFRGLMYGLGLHLYTYFVAKAEPSLLAYATTNDNNMAL